MVVGVRIRSKYLVVRGYICNPIKGNIRRRVSGFVTDLLHVSASRLKEEAQQWEVEPLRKSAGPLNLLSTFAVYLSVDNPSLQAS